MEINQAWIDQQRQISEIVDMVCEDAPGSEVPLLKQIEKSQAAALDALEAAYAEIDRLNHTTAIDNDEFKMLDGICQEIEKDDAWNDRQAELLVDYFPTIMQEIRAKNAEIARLTDERDAAVNDLRTLAINDQDCATCKHGENNLNDCGMYDGPCEWEWRGVCASNTDNGGENK